MTNLKVIIKDEFTILEDDYIYIIEDSDIDLEKETEKQSDTFIYLLN